MPGEGYVGEESQCDNGQCKGGDDCNSACTEIPGVEWEPYNYGPLTCHHDHKPGGTGITRIKQVAVELTETLEVDEEYAGGNPQPVIEET